MDRQNNKMYAGEILFHIAIPASIFLATATIGYCTITLVVDIMKIA